MISNQIILQSITDLKTITKVDIGVFELNGSTVAATFETEDMDASVISDFADSQAESQVIGEHHFNELGFVKALAVAAVGESRRQVVQVPAHAERGNAVVELVIGQGAPGIECGDGSGVPENTVPAVERGEFGLARQIGKAECREHEKG